MNNRLHNKLIGGALILSALQWVLGILIWWICNTDFLMTMMWISGITFIIAMLGLGVVFIYQPACLFKRDER